MKTIKKYLKRYFITAMSAMAQGLFASLLIGTIFKALGMIPYLGVLADIGTDHAHLPIYLVENGICTSAIGSDVRPGPIANAEINVKNAGFSDKISLRLASGLDKVEPDENSVRELIVEDLSI